MEDYKNTYNANTVTANKVIQNVGAMFQAEKVFVELRTTFLSDHEAFQTSIAAKITKLQEELATENKIMDALAIKEEKCHWADRDRKLPHDWMVIYNILFREKEKYEHAVSHLQLLIKSYIQEVGMMDVDLATVLRQKRSVVPKEAPKDLEKLKPGKIYKE
ncbi:unnamed protein product [Lactuca virosa]|uniref:Uncharacterized protein n=1 Tax=Lactuca virosa TaxID=75947 RepID=A0AAU9PTL5_9ASTR|nr:unnamed protein product [Lactuca virosa]